MLGFISSLGGAAAAGGNDDTENSPVDTSSGDMTDLMDPGGDVPDEAEDEDIVSEPVAPAPPVEDPEQGAGAQGPGAGEDTGVNVADGLEVFSGRVTTLVPEGNDIAAVRVLQGPQEGTLTVNPDNTLALVLSDTDYTGSLDISYEVTFADGRTDVVAPQVEAVADPILGGWGQGDFYMLETDSRGNLVVEHGDNHRDVYVSGDSDALTRQDIADIEGMDVERITGNWLRNNPQYGDSPETALAEDAGDSLWRAIGAKSSQDPASHWLHLEKGYEYEMDNILRSGIRGESELHPMHITAYGSGDKPVITNSFAAVAEGIENLVISDITFVQGGTFFPSKNIIMENVTATGKNELSILQTEGFTLRNSEIYDIHNEAPSDPDTWREGPDRISGIYMGRNTTGVLVENTLFDRNGWEEGYYGLDPDSPQAPSIFNHNVYIAASVDDLTFRDNISMRGASFGAQFRGGAVIENNVFLDNNSAVYVGGGISSDGSVYKGNYSIYDGNVITSGAHREYGESNGHLAGGIGDYAPMTTLLDNIVTHMSDPNNPQEQAEKGATNFALNSKDPDYAYYNDTIVYNWTGSQEAQDKWDANIDGLDPDVLDQTTIQIYAAQLLGDPNATIDDLALALRASAEAEFDGVSDAELITEFFQAGFGLGVEGRVTSETLRFVPDDLGDGMRWDNSMNWTTGDLPGTVAGDSVDLGGNTVIYGGTTRIDDLDFGDAGALRISHGRLDVTGDIETEGAGGRIDISKAGQFWTDGYADVDVLDINVAGGRFANTGAMDGRVDLSISDGQALLATDGARYDVGQGSRLEILGDDARIGFEGQAGDTAVLRFEAGGVLRFEARDGGIGTIEEFRSGANGSAENDVASGVNFGEGRLELDVADLGPEGGDYTLLSLDEMVGAFSEIDLQGLSDDRDAKLVFDYETDEVVLTMSEAGSGSGDFLYETRGTQSNAQAAQELWAALTEDQPVLSDDVMPDTVQVDDEQVYDFV
jgi:hypothetical protein